ncbi:MAG: CHAT domain-containing protein, partial [Fimbriimonadales bacterium]|nr:CHAT domain-containing protein [Fimbriimonadales bacterium]
ITRLEEAIRTIERQSMLIFDPDTQAWFSERYYEAYTLLALLEAERGNFARAAELIEQSRARVLTSMLYTRQLDWSGAPSALQDILREKAQIEALRTEQRAVIERAYASADETSAREASLRLAELDARQQALDERLRREFPYYARLFSPPALSLSDIQQQLDPDVALVYHATVENNLLIVVVTQREVRAYYRRLDLELRSSIERFRRAIVEKEPEAISLGRTLYQQLIEPAAESLKGYKRVLLCPEGELNQLPWAALVADDKPTYWVEQVAIHLTPSMGVYRYTRGRQVATQGALIAAVSQYQEDAAAPLAPPRQIAQRTGETRGTLENIPAVRLEAARLETLLKGATVLTEEAVTPEAVREQARTARLVHIACHARADSERPLDSALQLSNDEASWVRAGDIMTRWSLDADLVMLSACETLQGRVYRYEGIFGLARAFLFAGAKTVGASLWRVQDESTAELMVAFYENLLQGRPKDQALREAQLRFVRGQKRTLQGDAASKSLPAEPYHWAGFVIIGDCR